ncbi:16S rRNA (guanine(527)-N(7))-methyltransferase GidB [Thiovulum sp. ES]|nr:16S rRNA (guanine(527)-N(7))-methyltransferase GidB [Thiovulum sp. ES]
MENDIEKYISLLQKWNRVHNLTRMSEREIRESVEDSLFPISEIEFESFLDVGSGAGFPAIPIAIANREKRAILVEPIKKKSSFLHYVKSELGLKNMDIFSERVENLQIEKVDLITSRAVTDTKTLLKISSHLLKNRGKFLFYKGSKLPDEVEGLQQKIEIISKNLRNYLIVEN